MITFLYTRFQYALNLIMITVAIRSITIHYWQVLFITQLFMLNKHNIIPSFLYFSVLSTFFGYNM